MPDKTPPDPDFDDIPFAHWHIMGKSLRPLSTELYHAGRGNKAAARRARKLLSEIAKQGKLLREELISKVVGKSEPKPKPPPKAEQELGRQIDFSGGLDD